MRHEELLQRIQVDPAVCGGMPSVRGTRIPIAVLLGGLAEGMTPEEIISDVPNVTQDDVRGALAYAAELARESIWKLPAGDACSYAGCDPAIRDR